MTVNFARIPDALKDRRNWVLWNLERRGDDPRETKVPYQRSGVKASSTDPANWDEFQPVQLRFERGGWSGVGFVLAPPFVGIDLDGCRDPKTGEVAEWARQIVKDLGTYAEVSPSGTGIKAFAVGTWLLTGKKKNLPHPPMGDKQPAIEIYSQGRYFAVTGLKLKGVPNEPQPCQSQLDYLADEFFKETATAPQVDFRDGSAVFERARKYLAKLPPAISGSKGHDRTYHAACVLVCGFGLSESEAYGLLSEFNQTCVPPWTEKELQHKIRSAAKAPGERNYLRNATPERWNQIAVPAYKEPVPSVKRTTIGDAAEYYVERVEANDIVLVETGLPDLDGVIGGGVEKGELIIIAGLPSHGKSAVALQCVHHWTSEKMPGVIISEEMSMRMLGKRTLQFNSDVAEEDWYSSVEQLKADVKFYKEHHSECVLVESCGTIEKAVEEIERAIKENGAQFAVVDYAQLLKAPGKSKYEEVSNVSRALKSLVLKHNIFLVALCQLNREIEKRPKFLPMLSDIKDSGQLGQDADVVIFIVWPHRINRKNPAQEYLMFVAKNKNRAIVGNGTVKCKFIPSQQRLKREVAEDHDNFEPAFDNWNTDRKDLS